jgi:hypothetical protein
MTEDQIRELFREMRDEPVPPGSLARVRIGVAERGRERGRERSQARSWSWKIAALLLATGCVVLGALLFRPAAPIQKPELPMIARQAEVPVQRPAEPQTVRPVKHVRKKAVAARPPGMLIRIETPDPDVVILLVN